jgi:hypothetical protein
MLPCDFKFWQQFSNPTKKLGNNGKTVARLKKGSIMDSRFTVRYIPIFMVGWWGLPHYCLCIQSPLPKVVAKWLHSVSHYCDKTATFGHFCDETGPWPISLWRMCTVTKNTVSNPCDEKNCDHLSGYPKNGSPPIWWPGNGFSFKVQRRHPCRHLLKWKLTPENPLQTPCSWLPWPWFSREESLKVFKLFKNYTKLWPSL